MTYDEIIEQLEITKSKIKEIARNEYGGESWNDDLDALTEAADIVADYSKATAQASEMSQKYEQPAMAVRRAAGLYTCPLCGKRNTGRPHALSLVREEALLGQRSIRRPRLPTYEHEGRQETMIIQLEIPKEFAKDYANNRFDDFFRRVYADIDNEGMCGNYEGETAQMMARAFKESRCLDYEKTR